jgi:hypothetical protein
MAKLSKCIQFTIFLRLSLIIPIFIYSALNRLNLLGLSAVKNLTATDESSRFAPYTIPFPLALRYLKD